MTVAGFRESEEWKGWSYRTYVGEFLSLKCAGDVLNVAAPLGKKADKEISESMAIIQILRDVILKKPMQYTVYDLCAGNALTSLIAVHLLPLKSAVAIDKKVRNRDWEQVKRFHYFEKNIDIDEVLPEDSVIIAVHPCRDLALKIVDLFNKSDASYLIMMPCCIKHESIGNLGLQEFLSNKLSRYEKWCYRLLLNINTNNKKIKFDKKVLSPCNGIIVARK